jgi:hypothetical protein
MLVAVKDLSQRVSHPFYEKLNGLLAEQGFDDFVETQCRAFYGEKMGAAQSSAETIFSTPVDALLRRPGLGTRDWPARGGLFGSAGVSWPGADRVCSGSFDDSAVAAIDRPGRSSSGGVHVGSSGCGHCWAGQGETACDRRDDT